jgi:hypothetical protein
VLREELRAAQQLESSEARDKALAEVAWNALEIDPDLACEAFQQLPTNSVEKIRLIEHFAKRLAEQNPDEALAWAATLESDKAVSVANSQIALVMAESDPQRAAMLLSESGQFGRELDVAVVEVLQRWAAKSAPDAAAWAGGFPPGPAREAGIRVVVERWLPRDAPGALAWLVTLQDASVRREAALAMEETLVQQPQSIRDAWLQNADLSIRMELDQFEAQALREVGDNVPPSLK